MSLRSTYRTSRYHTSGRSWAVRLNDGALLPPVLPPHPIQTSALDLPAEQKFALVFLRKAGAESLANKIIKHLDEAGIPFPTGNHWRELRSDGYVTLEATGHRLTPKGHNAANRIMADLAEKYTVHDIIYPSRSTSSGLVIRCTCKHWHDGPFPNTRSGQLRADAAANGHLRDVKAGRWNPQRVTDFLNHIAPPQFNFSGTIASPSNSTMVSENGAERRTDVLRRSAPDVSNSHREQ